MNLFFCSNIKSTIVLLIIILGYGCSTNIDLSESAFTLSQNELAELFPPMPQNAPFELDLNVNLQRESGENVMVLQVVLQNPTDDTLHIGIGAPSGLEPYYNFAVITPDSAYIWSRLQSDYRFLALKTLSLAPSDQKTFTHTWDYTTPEGESIEEGQYFILGGIEGVRTSPTSTFKTDKRYGNVAAPPKLISLKP